MEVENDSQVENSSPQAEQEIDLIPEPNFSGEEVGTLVEKSEIIPEDYWEDHRVTAVVGYMLPVLFLLPLLTNNSKNSVYARFHSNQQLNLLLAIVVFYLISSIAIGILSWLGIGSYIVALIHLVPLFLITLSLFGILNASKGKMKELPVIGGLELIK